MKFKNDLELIKYVNQNETELYEFVKNIDDYDYEEHSEEINHKDFSWWRSNIKYIDDKRTGSEFDEAFRVFKFKNHEQLFAIRGWYSSYEGYIYDEDSIVVVEEKLVQDYSLENISKKIETLQDDSNAIEKISKLDINKIKTALGLYYNPKGIEELYKELDVIETIGGEGEGDSHATVFRYQGKTFIIYGNYNSYAGADYDWTTEIYLCENLPVISEQYIHKTKIEFLDSK